jgi:hypothetical protein
LLADAHRLASLLPELPHMAWAARNGLVEGNTEMYHRVGFAFDVFLRGESEGRNGLEALQEVIATGELEDPQGYLHAGFALYREAHLVGLLARSPRGSRGRQLVLESCRRHLVHEANLLIAVQEQALVLQRPSIFTHPVLHALLGAGEAGPVADDAHAGGGWQGLRPLLDAARGRQLGGLRGADGRPGRHGRAEPAPALARRGVL